LLVVVPAIAIAIGANTHLVLVPMNNTLACSHRPRGHVIFVSGTQCFTALVFCCIASHCVAICSNADLGRVGGPTNSTPQQRRDTGNHRPRGHVIFGSGTQRSTALVVCCIASRCAAICSITELVESVAPRIARHSNNVRLAAIALAGMLSLGQGPNARPPWLFAVLR
jgi:hypothetical protein